MVLTFQDQRFGDTYSIHLDSDGDFAYAERFLDRVGGEALTYETLEELPVMHREAIEELIEESR